MMIDASLNMVWQSDVDLTINRLSANKHDLADSVYFYQTVDNIEEMKTPDGKNPLTLQALQEWEERCINGPQEQQDEHDTRSTANDHPVEEDLENRSLRHPKKVIHPRPRGPLH